MTDFKQINKELEKHYSLFLKTNIEPCEEEKVQEKFEGFVGGLNLTSLHEQENEGLEAEISIDEVRNALKGFQNNKTPRDGFTKEFYEAFFHLLGTTLLDSFNARFENGKLSVS